MTDITNFELFQYLTEKTYGLNRFSQADIADYSYEFKTVTDIDESWGIIETTSYINNVKHGWCKVQYFFLHGHERIEYILYSNGEVVKNMDYRMKFDTIVNFSYYEYYDIYRYKVRYNNDLYFQKYTIEYAKIYNNDAMNYTPDFYKLYEGDGIKDINNIRNVLDIDLCNYNVLNIILEFMKT